MIHLSLSKDVETGLGVTSEEEAQGKSPTTVLDQKPPQNISHFVFSKETKPEMHNLSEEGKYLEPFVLNETHEFSDAAGRVVSKSKLTEDIEVRSEVITPVVKAPKAELENEINPEPNNKWELKSEQEVARDECIGDIRSVACQCKQYALEPRVPAYLTSKSIIGESLQYFLRGTQVSETPDLIQYWNNFIRDHSLKHYVFEIPMSSIMHLLLPLSFSKGTGALEKYKGLEEATTKQNTFSDQHQLKPQSKDPQGKSSNTSNIVDTIYFAKTNFIQKLVKTSALEQEQSKEVEEIIDLNIEFPIASIMHLSLSRAAKAGMRITKEAFRRPERGRGVIASLLIKEEPPDASNITKPSLHQGKTIISQNRMRTNLLSLDADYTVSWTKPFEEGGNDVNLRTRDVIIRPVADQGTMIDALQPKDGDSEHETTWRSFLVHQQHASKWNQPKPISDIGVTHLTNRVNLNLPDLDMRGLIRGFHPNQEDLSSKPTGSEFLIQIGSSENWILVKPALDEKVMNFLSQWIPDLPYLEPAEFGRLQTYLWRPGDRIKHLEALKEVLSCTSPQIIRRIQVHQVHTRTKNPKATEINITSYFARLSIREGPPRPNQCKYVYLTGKGAQNTKNLTQTTPEPQDTGRTSLLAEREKIEQEDILRANHEETLKDLNYFVFKRTQEEYFIRESTLNGPSLALTTAASKPAYPSTHKVTSIYYEFVQVIQSITVVVRASGSQGSSLNAHGNSLDNFLFILANFPFLVF